MIKLDNITRLRSKKGGKYNDLKENQRVLRHDISPHSNFIFYKDKHLIEIHQRSFVRFFFHSIRKTSKTIFLKKHKKVRFVYTSTLRKRHKFCTNFSQMSDIQTNLISFLKKCCYANRIYLSALKSLRNFQLTDLLYFLKRKLKQHGH